MGRLPLALPGRLYTTSCSAQPLGDLRGPPQIPASFFLSQTCCPSSRQLWGHAGTSAVGRGLQAALPPEPSPWAARSSSKALLSARPPTAGDAALQAQARESWQTTLATLLAITTREATAPVPARKQAYMSACLCLWNELMSFHLKRPEPGQEPLSGTGAFEIAVCSWAAMTHQLALWPHLRHQAPSTPFSLSHPREVCSGVR